MGILDSLLWTLERPQQSLFQGVQSGTKQFEKAMHEGYNPFYAFMGSLPSIGAGAIEGLVGAGEDIGAKELLPDLEQHMAYNQDNPEWNKPTADAIRNFIDITASPADILAPVGRALKVPFQTYKNLATMAPEYKQFAMKLGTPLSKIKDTLAGGESFGALKPLAMQADEIAGSASPMASYLDKMKGYAKDLSGVYGHYMYAPESLSDTRPLIIRSKDADMGPIMETILGSRAPQKQTENSIRRGLWTTLQGNTPEDTLNLIMASASDAWPKSGNLTFGHEIGHMLSSLLRGDAFQPVNKIKRAGKQLTNLLPKYLEDLPRFMNDTEGIAGKIHAYRENLPVMFPKKATEKATRGYPSSKFGEEILADIAGGVLSPEKTDRVGQVLQALVKNRDWSPSEAWNPWKQRLIQDIPTVPFAQSRRTATGDM